MNTQSYRLPNWAILVLSILSFSLGVFGLGFMQVDRFIAALISPPISLNEYLLTNTTQEMLPLFKATAHGDAMYDTEAYEETITTRRGRASDTRTTAYFGMLTFGDHMLMVKSKDAISESLVDYQGMLMFIRDDQVSFEIYNDYLTELPELNGVLVPMVLDASHNVMELYVVYGLMAVLVGIALAGFMTVWARRTPPHKAKIKR